MRNGALLVAARNCSPNTGSYLRSRLRETPTRQSRGLGTLAAPAIDGVRCVFPEDLPGVVRPGPRKAEST